jgi:hypothetical protein
MPLSRAVAVPAAEGRAFVIVARSSSYAICKSIAATFYPDRLNLDYKHPVQLVWESRPFYVLKESRECCCVVRDPVERFRSACARQNKTVAEGLAARETDVHFWSLKDMQLLGGVTHFRFPYQINDCAEWLGLPVPVPQENDEPDEKKPVLTVEQGAAVRLAYAEDIALYESLP